jgi:hypothetical protein
MHVELPDETDNRIQVRRIPSTDYIPREYRRSTSHEGSITMRIDLPDETRPYMQVRRIPSEPRSLNTSPTRYSSRASSMSPTRGRPYYPQSRAQTLPAYYRPQSRASSHASTGARLSAAVVLLVNLPDEENQEITIRRVDRGRNNSLGRSASPWSNPSSPTRMYASNASSPTRMFPQSPQSIPGYTRPTSLNIGPSSPRGRGTARGGTRSGYTSPARSGPSRAGSVFDFSSRRAQSLGRQSPYQQQQYDPRFDYASRDRSLPKMNRLREQQSQRYVPSGAVSSENLPRLSRLNQPTQQPFNAQPSHNYGLRPHASAPNLDKLATSPLPSDSRDDRDRSTKRMSRLKQSRGRTTGDDHDQKRSSSFGDKVKNLIGYSPVLKRTSTEKEDGNRKGSEKEESKRKSKKSKRTKTTHQ